MILWNDPTPATTLSCASITPLGLPVVPDVNTSWNTSSGFGRSQAATCASQSAGNVSSGSSDSESTLVVGKSARPASAGSGASRPVPSSSRTAPDASMMLRIASVLIRESSGT